MSETLQLARDLISHASVTPEDAGCQTLMCSRLEALGFECQQLRFDDTVYRLLGENLEDLTAETEFVLDAGTYQSRQLASVRLPGALVKEMAFTL